MEDMCYKCDENRKMLIFNNSDRKCSVLQKIISCLVLMRGRPFGEWVKEIEKQWIIERKISKQTASQNGAIVPIIFHEICLDFS